MLNCTSDQVLKKQRSFSWGIVVLLSDPLKQQALQVQGPAPQGCVLFDTECYKSILIVTASSSEPKAARPPYLGCSLTGSN